MKLNKLTRFTALSAALVGSASFAASNDALLDLLVQKGILSETEATAVAAELKEENKDISISAKGKETVKLRFNGRMQFQYDSLDADYAGMDTASTNHFYFRRLFFGVKANLENGVYAETVFDVAEEEFAFETAYFGYEFNDKFDVQLGYKKVPFGFEETLSSAKLLTIERSAANRFFADDIDFSARHTGVHVQGGLGGGLSYAVAAVNGAQGEGSRLLGTAEASNDLALFGRIQWESNGLTLGVDAGNQSNNDVVGSDVTAFTGYANYKVNGLNLLAEYFSADMNDSEDVEGYALRASYKINKFEPVIRYSYLETDGFVIDMPELIRRAPEPGSVIDTIPAGDNELDSFYFGVNYYYSPAVTFLAGYEIAEGEAANGDEYEIDGFRARIQVLW